MDMSLWRPNITWPGDKCEAIRPLAVWSERTQRLFSDRQIIIIIIIIILLVRRLKWRCHYKNAAGTLYN